MAQVPLRQEAENFKPKKFLMWLFIITSCMLFAALTSAYIVYTGGDPSRGIKVKLPVEFIYSTVLILISSATMHLAFKSAKSQDFSKQRIFLIVTAILGFAFFYSQYSAWNALFESGAPFVNSNASESFIYVFSAFHVIHILAGICMILYTIVRQVKKVTQPRNMYHMELTSLFWHFLDILWIYLYVFLLLNQ